MKRLSAVIGAILLAVSPTVVQAHDINQPAAMMPGPVYEYVQQAASLQSDGQSMTLQGVSPSTIFFSDRPYRLAGQIDTTAFARLWGADGTFAQSPPNAAVSVLGSADSPPAIVELTSAEVSRRLHQIRHQGPGGHAAGNRQECRPVRRPRKECPHDRGQRSAHLSLSPGAGPLLLSRTAGSGVSLPPLSSLLSAVLPALLSSGSGRCGRWRSGSIGKPAAICLSDPGWPDSGPVLHQQQSHADDLLGADPAIATSHQESGAHRRARFSAVVDQVTVSRLA